MAKLIFLVGIPNASPEQMSIIGNSLADQIGKDYYPIVYQSKEDIEFKLLSDKDITELDIEHLKEFIRQQEA